MEFVLLFSEEAVFISPRSLPDIEGARHEQRGPEQQSGSAAGGELPPQERLGGTGQHPPEHAEVMLAAAC